MYSFASTIVSTFKATDKTALDIAYFTTIIPTYSSTFYETLSSAH
jgi:hypothetical protein